MNTFLLALSIPLLYICLYWGAICFVDYMNNDNPYT